MRKKWDLKVNRTAFRTDFKMFLNFKMLFVRKINAFLSNSKDMGLFFSVVHFLNKLDQIVQT